MSGIIVVYNLVALLCPRCLMPMSVAYRPRDFSDRRPVDPLHNPNAAPVHWRCRTCTIEFTEWVDVEFRPPQEAAAT